MYDADDIIKMRHHVTAYYRRVCMAQRDALYNSQVSIDTACSSALVGAHVAAQHIRKHNGSALSAGVNATLAERTTAATQMAGG